MQYIPCNSALLAQEILFLTQKGTFFCPKISKKCLFGSKTVFLGQEVHYYMVYIAHFTELNLQICNYAQKRRIFREHCKYAFDENFHGHFCPRWKAAKFCHPVTGPGTAWDATNIEIIMPDFFPGPRMPWECTRTTNIPETSHIRNCSSIGWSYLKYTLYQTIVQAMGVVRNIGRLE